MQVRRFWAAAVAALCCTSSAAFALEGPTPGPFGGSDIRTAQLPQPGLYGGFSAVYANGRSFYDGDGQEVTARRGGDLNYFYGAAFLYYAPEVRILGGRFGLLGTLRTGDVCGRLRSTTSTNCAAGFGDPYVTVNWSRYFGHHHPSRFAGAPAVAEGLWVALGLGVIFPFGQYDATETTAYGTSVGRNVWDFAPTVAVTYTTPPLIADGTEFSARLHWNNYLTDPATGYSYGPLLNVDFAVSEVIGRVQVGIAGRYGFQTADDKLNGVTIAPDGRRSETLNLGPVLAVDIEGIGVLKLKGQVSIIRRNAMDNYGVSLTFARRLWGPVY